jgi:hypothetical protein
MHMRENRREQPRMLLVCLMGVGRVWDNITTTAACCIGHMQCLTKAL